MLELQSVKDMERMGIGVMVSEVLSGSKNLLLAKTNISEFDDVILEAMAKLY